MGYKKGKKGAAQSKAHSNDKTIKVYQRDKIPFALNIAKPQWTDKQKNLIDIIRSPETKYVFLKGASGTSKTFLSLAVGLELLHSGRIKEIILIRSIVESGAISLGSLPGNEMEKLSPFMAPFEEKLSELLPKEDIKKLHEDNRIISLPVNYTRGRQFNASFIIVDECFPGNTRIILNKKSIRLDHLFCKYITKKPLPLVLTRNEITGHEELKKIKHVFCNGKKQFIKLNFGARKVICTENHLFFTEKGWVEAKNLIPFEPVICNSGKVSQALPVLNEDQIQVMIGSYLGDGNIQKINPNRYRVKVIHGAKQKQYCEFKASIFNSEVNYIEKNGYSQTPAYTFTTPTVWADWYDGKKKKEVNEKVLSLLDARGLAIWYMDDGFYNKFSIALCTHSFSYDSQEKMVKMFKDKFNISCEIHEDKKKDHWQYYFLHFPKIEADKLLKLISPYMHPDLQYKTNLEIGSYKWNSTYKSYGHIVFKKHEGYAGEDYAFDLELEGNHNYYITKTAWKRKHISGILVHNCQNLNQHEIQTVITRLGPYSKMVLCGDTEQVDYIKGKKLESGFQNFYDWYNKEEAIIQGIHCFKFGIEDIMREDIIKYIVTEYDALRSHNYKLLKDKPK